MFFRFVEVFAVIIIVDDRWSEKAIAAGNWLTFFGIAPVLDTVGNGGILTAVAGDLGITGSKRECGQENEADIGGSFHYAVPLVSEGGLQVSAELQTTLTDGDGRIARQKGRGIGRVEQLFLAAANTDQYMP